MKKLSKIKGVTRLSREEQQNIKGKGCKQDGLFCCTSLSGGPYRCDPGQCQPSGHCFYY